MNHCSIFGHIPDARYAMLGAADHSLAECTRCGSAIYDKGGTWKKVPPSIKVTKRIGYVTGLKAAAPARVAHHA